MNNTIFFEDLKLLYDSLCPGEGACRGTGQGHSLLYSIEVNITIYSEDLKLLYDFFVPCVGSRFVKNNQAFMNY